MRDVQASPRGLRAGSPAPDLRDLPKQGGGGARVPAQAGGRRVIATGLLASRPAAAISVAALQEAIERHVKYSLAKAWRDLSPHELFVAVALSCRDLMVERMLETRERYRRCDSKRLYYLSIEFLPGQYLGNNLLNLGIREQCEEALRNLGANLDEIEANEPDLALGNGGLGRLAACLLDSMATL